MWGDAEYDEGQAIELFKNTFPTRFYYLLFDICNKHEEVESAKHVMPREKKDRQQVKAKLPS